MQDELTREILAQMFEEAPFGFLVWQVQGGPEAAQLVLANREASKILGIDVSAKIGRTTGEWLPVELGPNFASLLAETAARGGSHALAPLARVLEGGRRVFIHAELRAFARRCAGLILDNRGPPRFDGETTDEHQTRREHLTRMLEHAPGSIVLTDASARVVSANRAMPGALPLHEMIGLHALEMLPPDHRETAREVIGRVLETGEPGGMDVLGRFTGRWFRVQIGPVKREGRVDGLVCISADITAQKLAELDVERHSRELERSNADLRAFTHLISHDLKAPLRTVAGFVKLLAEDYQGKLDGRADEYIHFILEGIGRMRQMVDGLLQYARVGSRTVSFHPVPLDRTLDQAIANLHAEISQTHAEITRDALPAIQGDTIQVVQLFQNLLDNAIKYRVADTTPRVHVFAEQGPGEWRISVRDNGIGIAPENHDRVFNLFERLHTQREREGAGIGLSLCRRIAERHGGRIAIDSELGRGATFTFVIPDPGPAASMPTPPPPPPPPR